MKTLDKTERQVLLKKYMKSGLVFEEALIGVNRFHDSLKALNSKLRSKGKSKQDIEIRFQQEFEKICQEIGE